MVKIMDRYVIKENFIDELNKILVDLDNCVFVIRFHKQSIYPYKVFVDHDYGFQFDTEGFTVLDGVDNLRYEWNYVRHIEVYF